MKSVWFAVPGDLATPTGGYAYDRRVIADLRKMGWDVGVVELGKDFPRPGVEQKNDALAQLSRLPRDAAIVVDGLALGVLPEAAEELGMSHRLLGLVHHPLACESGLTAAEADCLRTSERRALAAVRGVIVTSNATARLLSLSFGVPDDRITVAVPGNDRVEPVSRRPNSKLSFLAVGAIVPRKGYEVLIAALEPLANFPWQLTIVGDCERDPEAVARLRTCVQSMGLADRVHLTGALSDSALAQHYAAADLFVLASRFEGYGMAISEAIAYGLPVVSTTAGAIPDTLPAGAGVLVPPDDAHALSRALKSLIERPAERQRLASIAQRAATNLPSWRQAAERFSEAIRAVQ